MKLFNEIKFLFRQLVDLYINIANPTLLGRTTSTGTIVWVSGPCFQKMPNEWFTDHQDLNISLIILERIKSSYSKRKEWS